MAPNWRWSRTRNTALRKAKLAPRSTMPSAASVRGTNIVKVIDAYASGKHVHRTTKTKINHTWFASHTGPIEWSMTSRGRFPRSAPPAVRSQKPAPKSAPPKMAYIVTAANRMIAAAVLIRLSPGPLGQFARPVWAVGLFESFPGARAATHPAQYEDRGDAQSRVKERDHDERNPDTIIGSCGV